MSFRLRFLFALPFWLFGRKLDITKELRGEYRVWPTEAEISIVENARYGYLFVLERFRLIYASGFWKHCWKHGWTVVLGAQIYKVKRPLHRWQKFTIVTKPFLWDEKWIYFEQRIESEGKLIASAVISVLFLTKDRKIPTSEVLGVLGIAANPPALPDAVKKFIAAEQALAQ
jgi:hypothetical protein